MCFENNLVLINSYTALPTVPFKSKQEINAARNSSTIRVSCFSYTGKIYKTISVVCSYNRTTKTDVRTEIC